jgi:hypothetical protein
MKKVKIILSIVVFLGVSAIFLSCKKDDTTIVNPTIIPSAGSASGSFTVQGAGYSNVSGSDTGTTSHYINVRNMTPANSYPSMTIHLSKLPTKDSTFNIGSINNVKVYTSGQTSDAYTILSGPGTIVFTKATSSYTVTFNSLTLKNSAVPSTSITTSGSITVYQ